MISKNLPFLLGYFIVSFIADKYYVDKHFYNWICDRIGFKICFLFFRMRL